MSTFRDYYDWHPSHDQELLLQAALLHGRAACQAWQEWSQAYDQRRLDPGSRRLLPLLYRNLKAEGVDHPLLGQFKKMYIDTWARNRVLFGKMSPLLESFQAAGIDTLVLKGASLVVRYYRDPGLRPMNDFDFLVPSRQAPEAVALLQRMDWIPGLKSPDRSLAAYLSVNYALHFSNPAKYDLDLHWHVLNECLGPEADRDFWAAAVPVEIAGVRTLGLAPSDDLLHACLHGARWNKMPPIRWVADAVTILESGAEIDWDRMAAQAEIRRLTLPLKDALTYLAGRFEAPIPAGFLKALDRLPVSKGEWKEYRTRTSRPGWSSYIPFLWAYYPRIARDTGLPPGLFGFIKYLQYFWELDHAWQVPFYAFWRSLKRFLGLPSD